MMSAHREDEQGKMTTGIGQGSGDLLGLEGENKWELGGETAVLDIRK